MDSFYDVQTDAIITQIAVAGERVWDCNTELVYAQEHLTNTLVLGAVCKQRVR